MTEPKGPYTVEEAKRLTAENLGCTVEDLDRATQMVRDMEKDENKIRADLFEQAKRCIVELKEINARIIDTIIVLSDMVPGQDITNKEQQRALDASNILIAFYHDLPYTNENKVKRILDIIASDEDDKKT